MGLKHTNKEPFCPSCEEKLKQADVKLREWFDDMREHFPTMHISCSYRGEKEQNEAVAQGKSKAVYPKSAHNKINEKGEPQAKALDIFELTAENTAKFDLEFYLKLWRASKFKYPLIWGGNFKSLGDSNHFELV